MLEAVNPTMTSAAALFDKHGVHAHKDPEAGIACSSGSLGCGITIAVGFALANPDKHVYVLCSDGESAEGSVWESLNFIHQRKLSNISVYVNLNGYAAYDEVDEDNLEARLKAFLPGICVRRTRDATHFEGVTGVLCHYHVMKQAPSELK